MAVAAPAELSTRCRLFRGRFARSLLKGTAVQNTAQQAVPATSAVANAVPMIGGKPAVELQDTIFTIGEETVAAELKMAEGKAALDVLDSNLHDIVKGLPYTEFMIVRDFH